MLAAHMDEVGLMITYITEDAEVSTVGGMDSRILIGQHVRVGDKKIPGIGYSPSIFKINRAGKLLKPLY